MEELKKQSIQKNTGLGVVLMVVCAVCLCMGQFIWKKYDGSASIMIGFVIYGLGALSMLIAYRFGSLSVLQPVNSISYIISAALGAIYFQEVVTPGKLLGILIIMLGIVLLARGDENT